MGQFARANWGMLSFVVATLLVGTAQAEPSEASNPTTTSVTGPNQATPSQATSSAPAPNPTRAAGWAVIGLGASLGLGSVATGSFLYLNPAASFEEEKVGGATLVGGIVTVAVALIVGIPMVVSGSSTTANAATDSRFAGAYDRRAIAATPAQAEGFAIRF